MSIRDLSYATLTGRAALPYLPALAALRAVVFRDWPYLYDAAPGYEEAYLATFTQSPRAAIVIAFDDGEPVGASTCLPLVDETPNVTAPFVAGGLDPARFFYFGESVLRRAYRGRGAGPAFFAAREAHARAVSACDYACFCSVVRAADDPRRPADAIPLDAFWRKRGFAPAPGLVCAMAWRELGRETEVQNRLAFWWKSLSGVGLP